MKLAVLATTMSAVWSVAAVAQVAIPARPFMAHDFVSHVPTGAARGTVAQGDDARLGGPLGFAMVPSGSDDTPAWDAACAAIPAGGFGRVKLQAGIFLAVSPWVCNGRSIALDGDGEGVTTILALHSGTVLTLAPSDVKQQVTVHGLTIAGGAACGTALGLLIRYPTGVSSYLQRTARVRDVDFVSDQAASAPGCHPNSLLGGLQITGTWNATVDNVHHTGPAVTPPVPGTFSVQLTQNIDIKLNDVSANLVDKSVLQTGYNEGVKLSHLTCLGTNHCSFVGGGGTVNGYNANVVTVNDADCDTYVSCIDWTGVFEGYIHDNRMASRSAVATPLVHLVDTTKVVVHENGLNGAAASQQVALSIESGALGHGDLNRVDNNICTNLAKCVQLLAGTRWNTVTGNAYPQTYGSPTLVAFTDAGTQNFLSWLAGPGSVAQAGGFAFRGSQGQELAAVPDVAGANSFVVLGAAVAGRGSPSVYAIGPGATNLNVAGAGGSAVVGPILPCAGAPSTVLCAQNPGEPALVQR